MSRGCSHCGLPLAAAVGQSPEPAFCCSGCEAVWIALHEAGLDDYYRLRQELPRPPAEPDAELHRYDDPEVAARLVERGERGARATFAVDGIHCASCAWVIEEALRREPSVRSARVALASERVAVELVGDELPLGRIAAALGRIGYPARPVVAGEVDRGAERARRLQILRFGVAAACAMNLMLFAVSLYGGARWGIERPLEQLFRWLSLAVATPLVAFSAWPILQHAAAALRRGTVHVDVPVGLAIAVMYGTSAWSTVRGEGDVWFDSLGMLVALLLGGRLLEGMVRRRAGERLRGLLGRQEETSRLMTGGGVRRVPPEELRAGDRIELLPGDVCAVDAAVAGGQSDVDLSVVDGEARPRPAEPGGELPAGARVLTGRLEATVLRPADAGSLAGLRRQVDEALSRRSPVEALADRIARWFVLAVLAIGAGTAIAWSLLDPSRALPVTVAVLVVACPCALALATPLAFAAAVHGAAARGLLVRRGAALLELGGLHRLAFDKTGTLTLGRPASTGWVPAPGWSLDAPQTLRLAAAAAQGSLHPVARAVVEAAQAAGVDRLPLASQLVETAGEGLVAEVEGQAVHIGRPRASVTVDGVLAGRLGLQDAVRPEARAVIARLQAAGLRIALLSGDEAPRAEALARQLGVDDVHAALRPRDKAALVTAWGGRVGFVGDGLNDAPALAAADVGLAMGSGVDLSVEAADGAIVDRGLLAVASGVALGRRLQAVLVQNISLSVAYNLVAVSAAAAGLLSPLHAAVLMPLSSIVVVVNAARLARAAEVL